MKVEENKSITITFDEKEVKELTNYLGKSTGGNGFGIYDGGESAEELYYALVNWSNGF